MSDSGQILLSIRNLCVDYISSNGIARAVNNITLDLFAGETLGLAGESGCGKSTLAFAISRLHKSPALISEGEINFEGQNVLAMDSNELARLRWNDISIVFQSAMNSLNPVITIGEQITDVILTHRKTSNSAALEKAAELVEMVGIHCDRLKSYPHMLSGGMRQRIAIAMALALEPKMIIMDEPTTALDVVVEREILNELAKLKEKFGFSVLFISHDLSLMGEISDRIGVMYAGKLVEIGETTSILEKPQHPYTQGLLNSFPSLYGPKKRMTGIPGHPLNLLHTPVGCYFRDRCERATFECEKSQPPARKFGTHYVVCNHPSEN